tara:strand:- start:188 stop:301 length:114 start_codon:yes stop_codon:yes gene_type:complete
MNAKNKERLLSLDTLRGFDMAILEGMGKTLKPILIQN